MPRVCVLTLSPLRFDARTFRSAEYLAEHGFHVSVLGYNRSHRTEIEETGNLRVIRLGLWSLRLGRNSLAKALALAEYMIRATIWAVLVRPHVYYVHNVEISAVALIARVLHRRPLVYDARELTLHQYGYLKKPRWFRRVLFAYEWLTTHAASLVYAANEERAERMEAMYKIQGVRALLNVPRMVPWERNDVLRDELRLPPAKRIILYQGLIREDRCLEPLVRAMQEVDGAVLVLMGHGSFVTQLQQLVHSQRLGDRVYFRDSVPQQVLLQYVMSADFGVALVRNSCLNNYFAAPSKMYDYLMAGIPVLTSDFPALRRIVETHKVGWAVNPDSKEELAGALRQWLKYDNEELRRRCRSVAEQRFNWQVEGERFLPAIRALVEGQRFRQRAG